MINTLPTTTHVRILPSPAAPIALMANSCMWIFCNRNKANKVVWTQTQNNGGFITHVCMCQSLEDILHHHRKMWQQIVSQLLAKRLQSIEDFCNTGALLWVADSCLEEMEEHWKQVTTVLADLWLWREGEGEGGGEGRGGC